MTQKRPNYLKREARLAMTNVSMINYSTVILQQRAIGTLLWQEKPLPGGHKTIHRRWYAEAGCNANLEQGAVASRWHHFRIPGSEAYTKCQKLLEEHYLPAVEGLTTKVVGSRGVVVHESFLKTTTTDRSPAAF